MKGKTVVCIASGPSLTTRDCAEVEIAGAPTIAVNSSWMAAPFCDVIYAGDPGFWAQHSPQIWIPAERWTCAENMQRYGCQRHKASGPYNSGMRAIQFAIWKGAGKVVLLGYDVSLKSGVHWHGPHTLTPNPDEKRVKEWHNHFRTVAAQAKAAGVDVVNCSRETALTCFRRGKLYEELC